MVLDSGKDNWNGRPKGGAYLQRIVKSHGSNGHHDADWFVAIFFAPMIFQDCPDIVGL